MENFPFFIFSSIISFSFCNLFYIRNYIDQFICFLFGWLVNQNHHHQHEVSHIRMVLQIHWIFKWHASAYGNPASLCMQLPPHLQTIPRLLHKWSLPYWLRNLCLLTNYSNISIRRQLFHMLSPHKAFLVTSYNPFSIFI